MSFEDARIAFRDSHVKAGFALLEEDHEHVVLGGQRGKYLADKPLLEAFSTYLTQREQDQIRPGAGGVCSTDYREQALTVIGTGRGPQRTPKPLVFGDPKDGQPWVQVAEASDAFVVAHLLNADYLTRAYQRTEFFWALRRTKDGIDPILALYPRPLTIQVYNIPAGSIDSALGWSGGVIDACLFRVAFAKQLVLNLSDTWPSPAPRRNRQGFVFSETEKATTLDLPKTQYLPDLLKFYMLGMSTDVPELQFLAFYQVLEFFFVSVSDERLYSQLTRRLGEPTFRAVPEHFDRIIQDVLEHRRVTDETEMLKLVLARYVNHTDLIAFLEKYQKQLGEDIYWRRRLRFGYDGLVSREINHTFGDIARIVKAVRNALVHSSDRHERGPRHVPFSESSDAVRLEVPLVRFLAERTIVSSAQAL